MMITTDEIRFVTYLSPSIPRALFEAVARHVAMKLGCPVSLRVERRRSGPIRDTSDPFSNGEADIGFMNAPAYLSLRERDRPQVEPLPVALVFADPRVGGRPQYLSDVIVHRGSSAGSFRELEDRTWAYNDTCSLIGTFGLLEKLAEIGEGGRFFRTVLHAKSPLGSINLVASRIADAAAIDSNVLGLQLRRNPGLQGHIRVIESWGPFPIPPVVARSGLSESVKAKVADALLGMGGDPAMRAALNRFGVERFAWVSEAPYEAERLAFRACEYLAGLRSSPHLGATLDRASFAA